jgi:hypothetical protein
MIQIGNTAAFIGSRIAKTQVPLVASSDALTPFRL